MHTTRIPIIKNAPEMLEFCIKPGDVSEVPPSVALKDPQENFLKKLIQIYNGENLEQIAGRPHPTVHVATTTPQGLRLESVGEYNPKGWAKPFIEGRMQEIKKMAETNHLMQDNPVISIQGWEVSNSGILIKGAKATYFQFSATNQSQDIPLSEYDNSFSGSLTLRSLEVQDGQEVNPERSTLANMLGCGMNIIIKGRDGENYFFQGSRKQNTGLYGGSLSMIGGTPHWQDKFSKKRTTENGFTDYMLELVAEELFEETTLKPEEYSVGKVDFQRNFTRAPEPIFEIIVNNDITAEDLADRCYDNDSALEEHHRLYAVPAKKDVVEALSMGARGFTMNLPTRVAAYRASE